MSVTSQAGRLNVRVVLETAVKGAIGALMIAASTTLPAYSQPELSKQTSPRPRIERPRPPRRPPPNQVQPGGGLDVAAQACTPDGAALTALVPVENPVFTMRAHPTFLFYFPDTPETVSHAEFILLSADEKEEIYTVTFTPASTGIVSVSLPSDPDKALTVGESYHWYLNLHCQTTESVPSVNGWVERIAVDSLEETATTSALPDVWYDELAQTAETLSMMESVAAQPVEANGIANGTASEINNDLNSEAVWVQWIRLLTAADLDELIDIPLIGPASVDVSSL